MKRIFILLLIFSLAFGCVACDSKAGNVPESGEDAGIDRNHIVNYIVKDGETDYSIVTVDSPDECITYAAQELQKYIKDVSGVSVPIVAESRFANIQNAEFISLGQTQLLQDFDFGYDFTSLNGDGFIMRQSGNALFIAGEGSTGTLNGVYDFCERILNIRFLTPDVTYTEQMDEIPLYEIDRVQIPAFSGRDYLANQSMTLKDSAARLRLYSAHGEALPKFGESGRNSYYVMDGHTNLETLLPPDKYPEHEDWYNEGKKELCYTNGITDDGEYDANDPDSMVNGMLEVCKQIIRENNTGAKYLMLGQADNSEWCKCDRCRASDEKYGRSGTLMIFCNVIAEQLNKWNVEENIGKEINVVTFAYWKTIAPPTKVVDGEMVVRDPKVIARDDVIVKIAHMSCNYHSLWDENCQTNEEFRNYFEGWSKVTDRLVIWDYATNFRQHFFWYPNFASLVSNYQYYRQIGAERVITQGAPHEYRYYQGHLENYIVAKLLWNPDQDINQLVKEFNHYYFGSSEEAVNTFVDLMNYHYATLGGEKNTFHTDLYDTGKFLFAENYPGGFLENAMNVIETEIERVKADTQLSDEEKEERERRLLEVYIMPQYMMLYNYENYADASTKRDFAIEFFANTDRLGIQYYGEGDSIQKLKAQYGVA